MNDDEEFAFNLRSVLGAHSQHKVAPTEGPGAGFDNLSNDTTDNFSGPAEVWTAFLYWAMKRYRATELVDLLDRSFRAVMGMLSLVLTIVLAATGYLFDEPDVVYEIGKVHPFGWVVFGFYVAMALFHLCTTQLPRFLTMNPGGCACTNATWRELPSLIGGRNYRAPLRNWTQGVVMIFVIAAFGGSALVILLHSILHMLLWGLESIVYPVLFSLYVLSATFSALAEASRHGLYHDMYKVWDMKSPIALHRASCYRTFLGMTLVPILGVTLMIVAVV